MRQIKFILLIVLLTLAISSPLFAQTRDLLSPEESLWLKSRNNTLVVYPEENTPPYSYKNSAGNPQGLAIDYLELIAEKIGAKIEYLTPRSRVQIMSDIQRGKGDIVAIVTPDSEREQFLIFTGNYISSPAVIVVRKDYSQNGGLNLNDFNGKRIAVVNNSSLESYVRTNYPRIVVDEVTEDEVALQQVVLGEVDASVMDVASLSYFLSKQVLNSVKVVGTTGFEYKPSFGVPKNLTVLQSILEKGLTQISASDRSLLIDKWIIVPTDLQKRDSLIARIEDSFGTGVLYTLLFLSVLGVVILLTRNKHHTPIGYFRKSEENISDLKEEVHDIEKVNEMLVEELKSIKEAEDKIQAKLENLDR